MSEHAIELCGLSKTYPGFALRNVNLTLPQGYVMGLVGPNGAGKTTLIKLLMSLIRRDGGELKLWGTDPAEDGRAVRARIGFVYDEPCFPWSSTLVDIKRAVSRFYPRWDEAQFDALAKEFGLPVRSRFKKLSHGTKTQFALALALSHHADLLILDEPTAGLDPVVRRGILRKISELLLDERKTVLFSTHVTSDLERIADYLAFIRQGEVVLVERKDTLMEEWGIVRGGEEIWEASDAPWFRAGRTGALGCEALVSDREAARIRYGPDVVVERPTLDEIVVLLNRGGDDD